MRGAQIPHTWIEDTRIIPRYRFSAGRYYRYSYQNIITYQRKKVYWADLIRENVVREKRFEQLIPVGDGLLLHKRDIEGK